MVPICEKMMGRVISNFYSPSFRKIRILQFMVQGKQTRSFQYIDDLVNGIVKTMNSDICGPVNLGNNK